MPPTPQTLFGLFRDPTRLWPTDAVREQTGHPLGGDPPDPSTWLGALNNSVQVENVRPGADADRVSVEADLTVGLGTGFLGYPQGWPFVLVSMPDVEFRIQPYAQSGRSTKLFASVGDNGCELVLEGLPVEIRLPPGLVSPHPDEPGDPSGELVVEVGEFEPGRLDDLKVVYRRIDSTSIFVHVRIYMSEAYEFDIQPAVPISFGRCGLSRIPCRTVHDFRLIPSHELAFQPVPSNDPRPGHFEWLRHGIEPWLPSHAGAHDGLFSVRSVDVDEDANGVKDAVEWLNGHSTDKEPTADFVLGDAVVPFLGPFWLPVPRHLTTGVRRKVLNPGNRDDVFAFEKAPVHVQVSKDPALAFIVESFYYRSQPAADVDEDIGLTFSAALVFGEDEAPQRAIEIGLEEDYTPVVGYKVDQPALFHFEIGGAVIVDVMAVRAGFSIARKLEDKSFADSALLTADLFVSMPPTGSDHSSFRLRGLNGEKVAFAMEGLGWRLGHFNKEGLALPDGVVVYVFNYALVISEFGLVAEDGASYLSFSGGLLVELPSGLAGGVTVKRLRFWMSGNESRPRVKLDGFFLLAHNKDNSVLLEAGGYYSEQETEDTRTREFGFTGSIAWKLGTKRYALGADLLVGDRRDPEGEFDYFMAQAYFRATIGPLAGWEFTGARLLYASNMLPKLAPLDRESRDLRYYRWYKEQNDPLTVPGDRRLASWRAERDSWSFGVGASGSLPAFGKVVELSVFVLAIKGPSEKGVLVAGEVFAFQNRRPLGYLVVEVDQRNDRTSVVIGVDARASSFVKDAPAWMDGVGKFTGTLFVSSDPDTFAIGRLADQHTWLTLRFDVDLWLKASLVIGICLELVEDGPKGFALTVRVEGGIGKKGVVRLTYNAGWTLVVETFTSGSSDYAAVISIEAGIRFVLFGFLRIGVSARMDFRVVGARPSRGELTAELRLETPWFLPDVTWRLDAQFGELAPERLEAAAPPCRSAGAVEPGTLRQLPTHVERFDPAWNGEGVAPVHSVAQLQAPTRPEAERLANLEADAALQPVATDATIGITWSVAVNDKLGLGGGVADGLGDQRSGDLDLSYDLVGIAVRRRPRFGPDRTWQPLEQKVELGPDFSDPNGVQLNGSFGPQVLNKTWDVDIQIAGQPAAKKLLLNGVAPYEFTTANPEADEQIVHGNPRWPCCPPFEKDLAGLFHHVTWRAVSAGAELEAPAAWRFTDSLSTLRFLRSAWSHPAGYAGLPPDTLVAAAELGLPGVVARADLEEDAAFCRVRMAWPRAVNVTLVALDGAGTEVRRLELGGGSASHQMVMLGAEGPIRAAGAACDLPAPRRWPERSRRPSNIGTRRVPDRGRRGRLRRPGRLPRCAHRRRGLRGRRPRRRRLRRKRQARVPAEPRLRAPADYAGDRRPPLDAGGRRRGRRVRLLPHQGTAGPERGRAHRRRAPAVRARRLRRRPGRGDLPRGAGDAGVRGGLPRRGAAVGAPAGERRRALGAAEDADAGDARGRDRRRHRVHGHRRRLDRHPPRRRHTAATGPRRVPVVPGQGPRTQRPDRHAQHRPAASAAGDADPAAGRDVRVGRSAGRDRHRARCAATGRRAEPRRLRRALGGRGAVHRRRPGRGRRLRRPAALRRRRRNGAIAVGRHLDGRGRGPPRQRDGTRAGAVRRARLGPPDGGGRDRRPGRRRGAVGGRRRRPRRRRHGTAGAVRLGGCARRWWAAPAGGAPPRDPRRAVGRGRRRRPRCRGRPDRARGDRLRRSAAGERRRGRGRSGPGRDPRRPAVPDRRRRCAVPVAPGAGARPVRVPVRRQPLPLVHRAHRLLVRPARRDSARRARPGNDHGDRRVALERHRPSDNGRDGTGRPQRRARAGVRHLGLGARTAVEG